MKTASIPHALVLALLAAGIVSPILGDTVACYSFEGSTTGGAGAPWRQDGAGNNPLAGAAGTISQAASVIDPVPFGSLPNAKQANLTANGYFYTGTPTGPLTTMSDFTVEAFIKWNGPYTHGGAQQRAMIVSQWDATGNLRSYQFGIDTAGHLFLNLNPGGSDSGDHICTSTIVIPAGNDYYVGVSFDHADTARGIKFYARKLADDQETLQIDEEAHALSSLRPPTARLVIGEGAYSGTYKRFIGLLDEVKISNVPLSRGELLIAGPNFRDFAGVNQTGATNSLFAQALSFARKDVSWQSLEPAQGSWQTSVLDSLGAEVLALQQQGVSFLPVLDYTAQWAADKTTRQWDSGNDRWVVQPRADGNMDKLYYKKQSDGSYLLQSTTVVTDFSKFPAANTADWTNYVQQVVDFLKQPPYNVRYFQIWNEAHPRSGFWQGGMDEYMQKVHIPAAQIIHAAGCNVVYGGWPSIGSDQGLPSLLDANNAWDTVDVLDCHYRWVQMYTTYRAAADSRGYPNIAVWETEVGWTAYQGYIAKFFPAALSTALSSNWNYADKYKAMYFANNAPNDPAAYGYGRCLYSGGVLAAQGRVLQTLASLLSGYNLAAYSGATLSPATTLYGFRLGWRNRKIVLAVQMDTAFYTGNTATTLTLPMAPSSISKLERVDLAGDTLDLTGSLVASGSGSTVSLPVLDAAGTDARAWNDATSDTRTFYVRITLQ